MSEHYGEIVQSDEALTIYQKVDSDSEHAYQEIAVLEPKQSIALAEKDQQDMHQEYFQLKDQEAYIMAEKVYSVNEPAVYSNMPSYYVPFTQSIVTKDSYTLYDGENAIVKILHPDTYPIYIKEDGAYGIRFHDHLFMIKQEDCETIQNTEAKGEETAKEIPVLMYHEFYSEAVGETRKNTNVVEKEEFHEQLQYLKDTTFTTLTMKDLDLFMDEKIQLPKKSIAITIDDGAKNIYQYAYPELKNFGFHATIFAITSWAGDPLPKEFQEMQQNNIEIQSHSHAMHEGGCQEGHGGRLLCIDHDSGVADTKESLEIVGNGFVYCYPFGDVNEAAKQIMKDSGVKLAFTTAHGTIAAGMDRFELPRIRIHGGAGLDRFINSINYE